MAKYRFNEVLQKAHTIVDLFDLEVLQERIMDLCEDIFDAEACSLFLYNANHELALSSARGYAAQFLHNSTKARVKSTDQIAEIPQNDDEKLGITGWIASTGKPFMANSREELMAHPHWRGVYDIKQLGIGRSVHNFYGIPLKTPTNEILGVLKVEGKRENGSYKKFTKTDAVIFDILGAYISAAIANSNYVDRINQQKDQLQTITEALQQVISALSEAHASTSNFLNEIIATTARILSAEACVLFLKDEERGMLVERAGKGYVEQLIGIASYRLIVRELLKEQPICKDDKVGITAWIAITGKPFLARNNDELRSHPHWKGQYDDEHYPHGSGKKCESFIGVPLTVADKVVGVLKVENKIVDGAYVPFTEQDQQVFATFAHSIAIAIGTVLEQRVKREQYITDTMYRVSQALVGKFELDPLLAEIVRVGKEITNAEACVVFLKDQKDPAVLTAIKGEGYAKHLEGISRYRLIDKEKLVSEPIAWKDRVGLTAWIAITGQPFLARTHAELCSHPHWLGKYDEEHFPQPNKRCNSFLGLPLNVGNYNLGVLKVENKKRGGNYVAFDERDQLIFQFLANAAAIAIHQNTRYLQKLQETQELAAIGRSAGAMAHRMGNPLQDILSTAGLLKEKFDGESRIFPQDREDIADIISTATQMSEAIERVRKALAPLTPKLEHHDLQNIIKASFTDKRSFGRQIHDRQITPTITGLDSLRSQFLRCDRDLLSEAISNLVENALEFVQDKGEIKVALEEGNNELIIEVHDDGSGVDERIQAKLFDPFVTARRGGLGLGLYIVRRNVEAHNGSVKHIAKDKGSCFRITIPYSSE